jgi:hypothetical protein
MKHFFVFFTMVLGVALNVQLVQAEEVPDTGSEQTDRAVGKEGVTPEGQLEEEGSVLEEGEEGEVTERGVRPRIQLPGKGGTSKPRPKITIPQKPRPKIKIPPAKHAPVVPPPGKSKQPPSGGGTLPPGQSQPVTPPAPQCVIQTSDIIDSRIENGDTGDGNTTLGAQESLMRLMQHGSVEERRAASSIIKAVKSEQLAGVHAPDMARKATADRAAIVPPVGTKGYWNLLAPGQVGMCLREPAGVPPMLLYRQKNMPPGAVEHTLVTNWAQCGLPTMATSCTFVVDLHKPPPQPGSTDEQPEGTGELQVLVQGEGKALVGVHVAVIGNRKEPLGFQNFQNESDPGITIQRSGVTNGEGIATFVLPLLASGIQIHVKGPPGFLNASVLVDGFILDKKAMIDLSPIEKPAS